MSKPIHLYQLDIDPATEQHLLSLTQRHLKLVLESGHRQTSAFAALRLAKKSKLFGPNAIP